MKNIHSLNLFSVHDLIMAIRLGHNLTQTEFAKKLDVVQSTISKIEAKKVPDIPFGLVCTISEEFSIPIDTFQKQTVHTNMLKQNNGVELNLKPYFTDKKIFSSKTLTILFDTISELTQEDLYASLGIKRCLFIFEDIKLNLKVFEKIETMFSRDEYDQFIDTAILRSIESFDSAPPKEEYKNNFFITEISENYKSFKYKSLSEINSDLNFYIMNTLYLELCILHGRRLERTTHFLEDHLTLEIC